MMCCVPYADTIAPFNIYVHVYAYRPHPLVGGARNFEGQVDLSVCC